MVGLEAEPVAPVDLIKWGILIVVGLALVWVGLRLIARVRRDFYEPDRPITEDDLLDPIRVAYAEGEIDEEEYRRIQESAGRALADPKVRARPSGAGSRPEGQEPFGSSEQGDPGSRPPADI